MGLLIVPAESIESVTAGPTVLIRTCKPLDRRLTPKYPRPGIRIEDSGNVRTSADTDGGLWDVNDNAITLASTEGNSSRTGTVSGNVMTLQSSGIVLGLTKQRQ